MSSMTEDTLNQLLEDLEDCYEEGQAGARMTPRAVKAARSAGLFTMTLPPDPCSMRELMYAIGKVAEIEPGVAWSASNSIVLGHAAARLDDDARANLLAKVSDGPFAFSGIPGGRAQPTESGFALTGEWPFVTGVDDSEIVILLGTVVGARPPQPRFFLMEPAHGTIGSNWADMAGMRTSGSNSLQVSEVAMTPADVVDFDDSPFLDHPLYKLPIYPYFLGTGAAVFLGVFRRALSETVSLVTEKISSVDGAPAAELVTTQLAVAEAEAALRACEASFEATLDDMWSEVDSNGSVCAETRGDLYRTFPFIVDTLMSAMSRLHSAASTLAWRANSGLTRAVTDLQAMAIAFERPRKLQLDGARVLLGLDPTEPMF